jgi:hypothetical protein
LLSLDPPASPPAALRIIFRYSEVACILRARQELAGVEIIEMLAGSNDWRADRVGGGVRAPSWGFRAFAAGYDVFNPRL